MLFSYHDRKSETVVMYVANSFFHSVNRLQRVVYTASQAISAEPRISTARKNAPQKAWKKVFFFFKQILVVAIAILCMSWTAKKIYYSERILSNIIFLGIGNYIEQS